MMERKIARYSARGERGPEGEEPQDGRRRKGKRGRRGLSGEKWGRERIKMKSRGWEGTGVRWEGTGRY